MQTYNPALRLKPDALTATGSGSGFGDLTLASGVRQSLSAVSSDAAEENDSDNGSSSTDRIAKGPTIYDVCKIFGFIVPLLPLSPDNLSEKHESKI